MQAATETGSQTTGAPQPAADAVTGLSFEGVGLGIGIGFALIGLLCLALLALRRLRPALPAEPRVVTGVEQLIRAGDPAAAAERSLAAGDAAEAARLYELAGQHEKAARCHLQLKQPVEAAERFARAGRLAEAAHYFQAAGAWSRAAECLHTLGSEREAAELYERAGEPARAADVLRALGDHENAARLFERAGQPSVAASVLRAATGPERSASGAAAGPERSALLRAARLFEAGGDRAHAAECYAELGEWQQAAERWDRLGEHRRAAEMFEKAGLHARAGEMYERAAAVEQARQSYERAGDPLRAAEMAVRLGRALDAARGFYQVAAYERAIETLQAVAEDSPERAEAQLLLGRMFVEKGLHDRAKAPLQEIARQPPTSREDLIPLALLGEAHERSGDLAAALEVYEQILEFDPGDTDANERVEELREKLHGPAAEGPQTSSRYELIREIGRGGMGVVHLAKDTELEREVAIKFLPGELASRESAVQMFRGEAKAAAAMNHPGIVTVFDVLVMDGRPAIVMEYVRGRTARQLMRVQGTKERQPVPPKRVAEIARDICDALSYAHLHNVIHRDVKPGNVIVDQSGRAKLMDFGISKILQEGVEGMTQAKGTPQYMPPEQILGREIDARTDLYALGISMFEIATKQRPFRGEDVVHQQLHRELPDPCEINPDVPRELAAIIRKACEKRPADRYQCAAEMAAALSGFLETQ